MSNLVELTHQLSTVFDACLENILTAPIKEEQQQQQQQQQQQHARKSDGDLDTRIANLKSSFLEIERRINDIRLKALSNKELSVAESNRLLKKDIEIKSEAIEKYTAKMEQWEKELSIIKENGRKALALRTDKQDFDATAPPPAHPAVSENNEQESNTTAIESVADVQSSSTPLSSTINESTALTTSTDHPPVSNTGEAGEGTPTNQMDVDAEDADDDDEDEDMEFEEV